MGKIMTKSQRRAAHRKKALKVGIPSLLALVLLIGGVFAATKFFGGKDAKDDAAARLDQVGNNDKTEEPEDDLRILLKDEEMEALYGNQKDQNIPTSSMGMMADLRIFLNSKAANEKMEDGVNIPVDMEQTVVDAKRATITSQTELQEALEAILADDMERIAAMPLADQGVEVERLLKKNLMDPKNGDMLNQALLEYPTFAEQNPWSVEFDEQVEEAMAREEDGKRPVGFWAFVQYANADAKKAQDLSQLRMSTKEDEATGMHNYWKTYCHLVASLEQLFTFEGAQTLESTENWHMSDMADWANTRIVKADYQEDKPAYIFVHRNKMGKITMKIGFNLADGRVELFEKKATPIPEDPKPKDKPDPDPDPDPDKYPATLIHYDVETGATLDTEGLGNFKVGVTVTGNSKSIANYTAMKDSVSGEMVEGGLTLRIPYTPKHDGDGQKDPEADPENKPGYDPGIGDNDPDDGKGDDQEEKPDEVDKENGPTENPDENRNDDGKDPTKPATPPITEDADEITVVDPDGSTSDVEKEPENTDKVNDSDPVQYGGAAVEAAPAVQAEPVQQEVATEVEAVEPVQEKKEAPAPEPVVVEAPAPAPAEQKAEPAEEAPAQESEADGAGEFQEDCP